MTLAGITRKASLSKCGSYRWTLVRAWDGRPMLLVVMFNPSSADHTVDDPTITLLCHIAAHNGYGGIVVVNGIPLRSSKPAEAVDMVSTWDKRSAWDERDALHHNLAVITSHVEKAGAVLLAWGALPAANDATAFWFDAVLEEIETALPDGVPLLCLGKTKHGWPLHPLARGKMKVRKDAPLLPWKVAA
jgi:hypothetical protein